MTATAHDNEGQRKGIAMGVSLAVHALLIRLFILDKIITPIPPFPENGELLRKVLHTNDHDLGCLTRALALGG